MRNTYYAKDSRHAVLDRVHRRRAIAAGAKWEKINLLELFKQNNNCAICKTEMNWNSDQSDPLYVSIDHIVSFKNGGSHTKENIQLVHIGCNRKKGAK